MQKKVPIISRPGGISLQDYRTGWRKTDTSCASNYKIRLTTWRSGLPQSVIKACGLLVFREDFETILLLEVFSDVISFTNLLYNLLQTKDFVSCTEKIKEIQVHPNHDRGHSPFNMGSCCITEKSGWKAWKTSLHYTEKKYEVTYKCLYVEITAFCI